MVGIRRSDHQCISIGDGRYEDAGIASRNDDDLVSYAGSLEHPARLDGLSVSADRPALTASPSWEPWEVRIRKRMSLSPFIFFVSACNVAASASTVALPPVLVLNRTTIASAPNRFATISAAPVASLRKTP